MAIRKSFGTNEYGQKRSSLVRTSIRESMKFKLSLGVLFILLVPFLMQRFFIWIILRTGDALDAIGLKGVTETRSLGLFIVLGIFIIGDLIRRRAKNNKKQIYGIKLDENEFKILERDVERCFGRLSSEDISTEKFESIRSRVKSRMINYKEYRYLQKVFRKYDI